MVPAFIHSRSFLALITFAVCLWADPQQSGFCAASDRPGNAELKIAAASDLRFAFRELIPAFEQESGIRVTVAYGASGTLYAQLRNGAPFDLFLSADAEYPRRLEDAGFGLSGGGFDYAIGRLVLWYPERCKVDFTRLGMRGLLDSSVRRIAIANPEHAPYGRAAVAAMQQSDVYNAVRSKLVFGENLAQAAQFVGSGAADVGILAESLARASELDEQGDFIAIPREVYPEMRQRGIIMEQAKSIEAARRLRDWITGGAGRGILKRWGFMIPGENSPNSLVQ